MSIISAEILKKPQIMGILNITPDSFSDANKYSSVDKALYHVEKMLAQGATIIDVGGESTRPGAQVVSVDEELARVIPVIKAIKERFACDISIDTSKAEVMLESVQAGANMINDVNALQAEGAIETAASLSIPICLMHMQGNPQTMQLKPSYTDIVDEVKLFFQQRLKCCDTAGINKENIILDPGFGFGKTLEHNLLLLSHLDEFKIFNLPLLVGLSRKSLLASLTDKAVDKRLAGSISLAMLALQNGANILRVHDVDETMDMLKIFNAVLALESNR